MSPSLNSPLGETPILQLPPLPHWATSSVLSAPQQGLPPTSLAVVGQTVKPCLGITCQCGQNFQRCLILDQFHCTFDKVHGYIHCISHGCLIPTSLLKKHLSKEHVVDFRELKGSVKGIVEKIKDHLQDSYGLDRDQKLPELNWKLKHLIPQNRDVILSSLRNCPHCSIVLDTVAKARSHCQNFHQEIVGCKNLKWKDLPVVKIAQKPFGGWEQLWYEVIGQDQFTEEGGTALGTSDISVPLNTPSTLPPPQFCQTLGYISWIESIGRPPTYNLIAIPRIALTRNVSGKDGLLEKTLLRIHTFLKEYLGTGEQWIFAHHRKLEGILRIGYVPYIHYFRHFLTYVLPFSSRNPHGRTLSSPIRYRASLSMVISFFIRLYHLQETGRCPPKLVIKITDAQDKARKALYTAAFQEPGPPDMEFAQMVHTLCESLLCARTSSLEKIFGPIEFAFCFYMQRPDGSYRSANNLTQFFASIQWCLRNILGHIVRLKDSGLTSYTPYHHLEVSPSLDHVSPSKFPLCLIFQKRVKTYYIP